MVVRLKTSKEARIILDNLNRVLRMSNNAVILRFAISKSIMHEVPIEEDPISEVHNNSGFEINRNTLYGENEIIYKLSMDCIEDDERFFPYLTNRHIERGLKLLDREYKLAGNKDKFITNIVAKLK